MSKQLDKSPRTGRRWRRQGFRPQAEALESRNLLSGNINNTLVWFTMPLPTVAAPNGSRIGAVHLPAGVTITSALTPNPPLAAPGSNPVGITIGPDSTNLWVTENNAVAPAVQEISPSGTVLLTVPLPAPASTPEGITVGPDGNLWVALHNGFIDRITTAGVVTAFALAGGPEGITSSGGFLYVTLTTGNAIDQGTTLGVFTPLTGPAPTAPVAITAGPNNTVWFTEPGPAGTNQIGEITNTNMAAPTAAIATAAFLAPAITAAYNPVGITADSAGNIWFTMQSVAAATQPRIGEIHTNGTVTSQQITTNALGVNYVPVSITAGPDGNVWFTMRSKALATLPDRIGEYHTANLTITSIAAVGANPANLTTAVFNPAAASDLLPFGITGLPAPDDPPPASAPVVDGGNALLAASSMHRQVPQHGRG